jgi:hypothetical protein
LTDGVAEERIEDTVWVGDSLELLGRIVDDRVILYIDKEIAVEELAWADENPVVLGRNSEDD